MKVTIDLQVYVPYMVLKCCTNKMNLNIVGIYLNVDIIAFHKIYIYLLKIPVLEPVYKFDYL